MRWLELPWRKNLRRTPLHVRQAVGERGGEAAKTVSNAAPEANRGRFGKVARRATDFGNGVAKPKNLRKHLVIKDEVIGVGVERQAFEERARNSAVAGVIFRKLC